MTNILNKSRKSNFLLEFDSKELPDIKMYITNSVIPSFAISEQKLEPYAVGINQVAGRPSFGDLSFEVISDENLEQRNNIHQLMKSVSDPATGIINPNKRFNIYQYVLSNKGNPIRKIKFTNCWIPNCSELQYASNGDDYQTFTIQVYYEIWDFENI